MKGTNWNFVKRWENVTIQNGICPLCNNFDIGMSFIIYLHVLFSKMKEIVSYHLSASQNQTYIKY